MDNHSISSNCFIALYKLALLTFSDELIVFYVDFLEFEWEK